MNVFLADEKIYSGKYPIRYVLKEHPGAKWLVVVFSAFAAANHPVQHPYHFTNALEDVPAHRLYIQDSCGRHGTYYLCERMDFSVEETVSSLIAQIQKKVLCDDGHTISIGSSKGGSAAVYYALKHSFSHAVAMVPQLLIGTYVRSKKETLEDMIGDADESSAIGILDGKIMHQLSQNRDTTLHILTSEHDEQYQEQIGPFLSVLEREKLLEKHDIVIENRIKSHSGAAVYNSEFTHEKLCECMYGAFLRENNGNLVLQANRTLIPKDISGIEIRYCYECVDGKTYEIILGEEPQTIPIHNIIYGEILIAQNGIEIYQRTYIPWVKDAVTCECRETETTWEISFKTPPEYATIFEYAYYIFDENNKRIYIGNYSREKSFSVPRNGLSGRKIQYFWRYKRFGFNQKIDIRRNIGNVDVDHLSYDIRAENQSLVFAFLNLPEHYEAEFAYYICRNGQIIEKTGYSTSSQIILDDIQAGFYSVIYFVRVNGEIKYKESRKIAYYPIYGVIVGPKKLEYLASKSGMVLNRKKNDFIIFDFIDKAISYEPVIFQGREKNMQRVAALRKEILDIMERSSGLRTYLIRWNFWNVSRSIHWILEECYDVVRTYTEYSIEELVIDAGSNPLLLDNLENTIYSVFEGKLLEQFNKIVLQEANRDLDLGRVEVLRQGNVLSAEIQLGKESGNDRFAFYLLRNGRVIEKTEWSQQKEYSWILSDSGRYTVRGFVKRGDLKVVRNSAPVTYFTAEDMEMFRFFMKQSNDQESVLGRELKFYKSEDPLCDICIVSRRNAGPRIFQETVCANIPQVGNTKIGNWQTAIYANAHPIVLDSGTRLLMSGSGVFSNVQRVGMNELTDADIDESSIFGNYGQYSAVTWNERELALGTDLFAFKRWFFYSNDDLLLASNSYHLLLIALKEYGQNLQLDIHKACVTLSSMQVQMFMQNFTRKMDMVGVRQISADKQLKLEGNTWRMTLSSVGEILANRKPYHEEEYQNLLRVAREELLANGKRILNDPHYKKLVADLTGGLDSRLVYSIFTNLPESRNRIMINSQNVPGSKDLPIAVGINHIYQYEFNTLSEDRYYVPTEMADMRNRSFYLGTYYSHTLLNSGREQCGRVDVVGACGEILARPYVSRKYLRSRFEKIRDTEDFLAEWYRDVSMYMVTDRELESDIIRCVEAEMAEQPAVSKLEALERIYTTYRHGYHFDTCAMQFGFTREYPLQSKTLFQLHVLSYGVHKSIKLELDMLYQMNPLLASIEFDSDADNQDAEMLKDDLVIEDKRFQNVKMSLDYDMKKWNDADEIRRSRVKNINRGDQASTELPRLIYKKMFDNFRELMNVCPELCEKLGMDLYYYLMQLEPKHRETVYWYNKITSLLDQIRIFQD